MMWPFAGSRTRHTFQGYAHASRVHDGGWGAAILVFRAGVTQTRPNSITGGGQLFAHAPEARQGLVIQDYAPGVPSYVGAGQLPALPPSLLALYGGAAGRGN